MFYQEALLIFQFFTCVDSLLTIGDGHWQKVAARFETAESANSIPFARNGCRFMWAGPPRGREGWRKGGKQVILPRRPPNLFREKGLYETFKRWGVYALGIELRRDVCVVIAESKSKSHSRD